MTSEDKTGSNFFKSINENYTRLSPLKKFLVVSVYLTITSIFAIVTVCLVFIYKYEPENLLHCQVLPNPKIGPRIPSPVLNYNLSLNKERFFLVSPDKIDPNKKYGLIVFINSTDRMQLLPPGWEPILKERNLFYVAPFNCGNGRNMVERESIAVLCALSMIEKYNIDPHRVYIAGMSGGAQMASQVAFLQPNIFSGTIQNCGTNFYRKLKLNRAPEITPEGWEYNYNFDCPLHSAESAKKLVKFALVTGGEDFDRNYVLDIYELGFKNEDFKVKLFDVKEMQHENCSAKTLEQVLDYLDAK